VLREYFGHGMELRPEVAAEVVKGENFSLGLDTERVWERLVWF
jgi:hypothetical protein